MYQQHLHNCQNQECAEICKYNKLQLCLAYASEIVHRQPVSAPSDTRQQQYNVTVCTWTQIVTVVQQAAAATSQQLKKIFNPRGPEWCLSHVSKSIFGRQWPRSLTSWSPSWCFMPSSHRPPVPIGNRFVCFQNTVLTRLMTEEWMDTQTTRKHNAGLVQAQFYSSV